MTAECRDDNDINKQFRRQNAVGNTLVRKFSFALMETELEQYDRSYIVPKFMEMVLSYHFFPA